VLNGVLLPVMQISCKEKLLFKSRQGPETPERIVNISLDTLAAKWGSGERDGCWKTTQEDTVETEHRSPDGATEVARLGCTTLIHCK
jgi:hypothetical protein